MFPAIDVGHDPISCGSLAQAHRMIGYWTLLPLIHLVGLHGLQESPGLGVLHPEIQAR